MRVKEEEDISYGGQSRNYESWDGDRESWKAAGHDGEEDGANTVSRIQGGTVARLGV